ncbi:MAG: hypothetical protein GX139_08125 [Armatimonadetes bacterium]|nr:hypothetical protein [Armatimonadota bacterium]
MKRIALAIILCLTFAAAASASAKAWFADITQSEWYLPGAGQFVNNPLYNDPFKCLGYPTGGQVYEPAHSYENGYCVSLGDRDAANANGRVMVGFSTPVADDPRNPYGLDFIVFGNAYFRLSMTENLPLYADPNFRWQEPAFVEISQDGDQWYLIRPNILPNDLIPAPGPNPYIPSSDTGFSSTGLYGYADCTPTIELPTAGSNNPFSYVNRTPEELYTVPDRPSVPSGFNSERFDYVSGGGDAFDIADAVVQSAPGVPALDSEGNEIKANIGWFKYVRLTDAVAGDYFPGLGEISAEIDAVAACRPALSIGEAKKLADGEYALITDAIVTATLPDAFFIESPNRSAAMKVIYNTAVAVDGKKVALGDKMTITGHISKGAFGFALPDPMWTCTEVECDLPNPVGMRLDALADDLAYGMRVRVWGRKVDAGPGFCVINDGSANVKLTWTNPAYAVADTPYLSAVGVCDRSEDGSAIVRLSDPQNDITIY